MANGDEKKDKKEKNWLQKTGDAIADFFAAGGHTKGENLYNDAVDTAQYGAYTGGASLFGIPGYVSGSARNDRSGQANAFTQELDRATDTANKQTMGVLDEQYGTAKEKLNPWQYSNYATDGGQYGRWNGRDYRRTLRLAREADAYNNAPVEHMFSTGTFRTGGVKDLGVGYERPKIDTMETRAIDQTINLDTNQKQLAQSLQDAVNHKDLNAFVQAYAQRYNIVLSREQAEVAMRQLHRSGEIQQVFNKDFARFAEEFTRGFTNETVHAIYNYQSQDPVFATMLYNCLANTTGPSQQMYDENFLRQGIANALATQRGHVDANGKPNPDWQDNQDAYTQLSNYTRVRLNEQDYRDKQAGGVISGEARSGKLAAKNGMTRK